SYTDFDPDLLCQATSFNSVPENEHKNVPLPAFLCSALWAGKLGKPLTNGTIRLAFVIKTPCEEIAQFKKILGGKL
ncbi:MAG: hypothetical protein RRY04_07860, partial [Oscillospiraceae bacterium]